MTRPRLMYRLVQILRYLVVTQRGLKTNDIRGQVHAYAEKCMFDVFLEICKADYVGVKSGDSETKMVREICKSVGKL